MVWREPRSGGWLWATGHGRGHRRLVSLLGTSALVRLWGALAVAHGPWRTVAMNEGEMSVSVGGSIVLLIGGLAATALSWRCALVIALTERVPVVSLVHAR